MATTTANTLAIFQGTLAGAEFAQSFVNADGTALKTIFTADATNGSLVDNIAVTSDDTVAIVLVLTINNGTADFTIGEVSIPAGAGTDGSSPAVNLLDAVKMPWLQSSGGIPLPAGSLLKVNAKTAVTASQTIYVVPFGGHY